VWELADYFDVPEDLAYRRVNDFATDGELDNWRRHYRDGLSV